MKKSQPIKNVTVLQTIGTVMEFLTIKNSTILLTLLGVFSPFLHLLARPGQEGVFGWSSMANFLDSFGWALCAFFLGLSYLIESFNASGPIKKSKTVKAVLVLCLGFFYGAYTIIPLTKDFTRPQYYGMLLLLAFFGCAFSYITLRAFRWTEANYRLIIKSWIGYAYEAKDDIREEKQIFHELRRGELIKETLDNVGS